MPVNHTNFLKSLDNFCLFGVVTATKADDDFSHEMAKLNQKEKELKAELATVQDAKFDLMADKTGSDSLELASQGA